LGDECLLDLVFTHVQQSLPEVDVPVPDLHTQQCRQQCNMRDNIQLWHTRYNIQQAAQAPPPMCLSRPDSDSVLLSSWAQTHCRLNPSYGSTAAQLALPGYPQCDRCACAGTQPCRRIRDAVILCEYSSAPSAGRVPRHSERIGACRACTYEVMSARSDSSSGSGKPVKIEYGSDISTSNPPCQARPPIRSTAGQFGPTRVFQRQSLRIHCTAHIGAFFATVPAYFRLEGVCWSSAEYSRQGLRHCGVAKAVSRATSSSSEPLE
jgi:hypothetical protein